MDAVYRKHFALPSTWRGDRISLRFEGVYKTAHVCINGALVKTYGGSAGTGGWSAEAYTEFEVRLDNVTSVSFTVPNVIAIYVNGDPGNEHWYTGAGLYRSVQLVRTRHIHVDPLATYFPAVVGTDIHTGKNSHVLATVHPILCLVNDGTETVPVDVLIRIFDSSHQLVSKASSIVTIAAASTSSTTLSGIIVPSPVLWSIQNPYLYSVRTDLMHSVTGELLDSFTRTLGIRSVRWDYDSGFYLNDRNVKLRGFCHHDSFTGVGMALPSIRFDVIRKCNGKK